MIQSLLTLPFFEPLSSAIELFQNFDTLPEISALNEKLATESIRFVPQEKASGDFLTSYEPRIYLKGEIQTREQSWHDFFNALVWRQFPKSKKIINALHYRLQIQRHPSKQRLPAENMLTLFDENGAIALSNKPELLELIRQHRWHELFWLNREEVNQHLKVIIFGHGLYEKALRPYIGLTAKTLLIEGPPLAPLDELITNFIERRGVELEPAHLNPLPILGLPGWWRENEDESFYANKAYFRENQK